MTHTTPPALNADNVVALVDNTELETVGDGPFETTINILLPDLDIEVGLLLGEEEGPHTAVEVGVLWSRSARRTECLTFSDLPLKRGRCG